MSTSGSTDISKKSEENWGTTYDLDEFRRRLKRVRPRVLRQLLMVYYSTFFVDIIGIEKHIGSGTKVKPGIAAIEEVLDVSKGKAYDLLAACDLIRSIFVGWELDQAERRALISEKRLRASFLDSMSAGDYESLERGFASCFSEVARLCGVRDKSGRGQMRFSRVRKRIGDLAGEVQGLDGGLSSLRVSLLLDEVSSCFV